MTTDRQVVGTVRAGLGEIMGIKFHKLARPQDMEEEMT